jgi:hypothetical protein
MSTTVNGDSRTRKRARGSYARLICLRCRERRIKCQLIDDGTVVPSSEPQPPEKACQRCRQQGLQCVVRRTTLGRPNVKNPPTSSQASTGQSGSKSPSPDPEDLVLLALDERSTAPVDDRTLVADRKPSGAQVPTDIRMYAMVNRTFGLTSTLLYSLLLSSVYVQAMLTVLQRS